jgi:serine/threonine protein kinase
MPNDQQVSELLLRWEELQAQGQPVAAEELCRDRPELLPEVKRRLEVLGAMYQLLTVSSEATPSQAEGPHATQSQVARDRSLAFLAPAQQPDEIGRLGAYRVLKLLGMGGMGMVFQAEDPQLQRHVALKVMRPEVAATPSSRQRFLREARAVAALEHEAIVPIYQVGEDRGVLFLVMPLLKGESLDKRLRREGQLPPADVLRIGQEIAQGLAAAHERGLVHRDIKPSNLWLQERAGGPGEASRFQAKVLDFGLARSAAAEGQLTQTGSVPGTPAYMSPEQADGQRVDARSDLFSLGCVLYYMATGQPPFRGHSLQALLRAVTEHHPPPPGELRPGMPPGLSDLIMRLLHKDREARPSSAREVAETLRELEGSRPTTQVEAARPVASSALPRRRMRASLLAAAGAGVVVVGLVLWQPWASTPRLPDPPSAVAVTATSAPLQVEKLRVFLFKNTPTKLEGPYELGSNAFAARFEDRVHLNAEFSEPLYFFLLAFNPDGKEQLCRPSNPRQPPEREDRLDYPAAGADFCLNDGVGLQAFVLLASRQPLPAYDAWKAQRSASVWRTLPARNEVVWRGDGKRLQRVTRGGDQRGQEVTMPEAALLAELCEQLRQAPGVEALAVAAFAVFPAEGEN